MARVSLLGLVSGMRERVRVVEDAEAAEGSHVIVLKASVGECLDVG